MRTTTGIDVTTLDDYLRYSDYIPDRADEYSICLDAVDLGTIWATRRHVIVWDDRGAISSVRVPDGHKVARQSQSDTARTFLEFADDLDDYDVEYLQELI